MRHIPRCSFCGKPRTEMPSMVLGPGVNICGDCVRLCCEVLGIELSEATERRPSKGEHDIPVVILCGGKGMRLQEHTAYVPKALIEIGGRPILWHVMKIFAHHGFERFILCLGHLGHKIKEFFTGGYMWQVGDVRLHLQPPHTELEYLGRRETWEIIFADTGEETQTGGRIKRIERYINTERFFVTYVDGLADIDLHALLQFHLQHKRLATLTTVRPISPFGILNLNESNEVVEFHEKPQLDLWINGGFFVFERRVFDYLGENDDLERETLVQLATERQLMAYRHTGFWACMDTYKDTVVLNQLWESGRAPWKVWED
ncbi:MAG TPA: glucose-1-phosphate cytidylyltransferase [Armatimonadetes bacterium]|nr:glucose-1-phosphate cytidylyltransferase [Armatimonadota bacterium]